MVYELGVKGSLFPLGKTNKLQLATVPTTPYCSSPASFTRFFSVLVSVDVRIQDPCPNLLRPPHLREYLEAAIKILPCRLDHGEVRIGGVG